MANYNDNNIVFSLPLTNSSLGAKGKIQHKNNDFAGYENGDKISQFVNAVEIDWNNAQLGTGLIRPIGEAPCSRVVPMGYRRFAII